MERVCHFGVGTWTFLLVAGLALSFANADGGALSAREIVQESVQAMGGAPPADARILAAVTSISGGSTESGVATIVYKSILHSKERFDLSGGSSEIRLQNGDAAECEADACIQLPLEQSVTSYSGQWPLFLLHRALSTAETRYQYLVSEPVNGVACHHLRIWDFNDPGLTQAWAASAKEIWIGVESKFPLRLSFVQRMNWGGTTAFRSSFRSPTTGRWGISGSRSGSSGTRTVPPGSRSKWPKWK